MEANREVHVYLAGGDDEGGPDKDAGDDPRLGGDNPLGGVEARAGLGAVGHLLNFEQTHTRERTDGRSERAKEKKGVNNVSMW